MSVQVLVRWKSKLHLGKFWLLEASGKRWRTQNFMLRVYGVARLLAFLFVVTLT